MEDEKTPRALTLEERRVVDAFESLPRFKRDVGHVAELLDLPKSKVRKLMVSKRLLLEIDLIVKGERLDDLLISSQYSAEHLYRDACGYLENHRHDLTPRDYGQLIKTVSDLHKRVGEEMILKPKGSVSLLSERASSAKVIGELQEAFIDDDAEDFTGFDTEDESKEEI